MAENAPEECRRVGAASELIEALAETLWKAEADQTPVDRLTTAHPDLSVVEAYAIQTRNIDRRIQDGRVRRGRKVGLTSRAMQDMMGVREPDFGVLLDDMFVEEGDPVIASELVQPRVEAEIALVLTDDLRGPGVTSSMVFGSVGAVCASIEIIDSRIREWDIGLVDTIADNASSARVVVAGNPISLEGVDLRLIGMALHLNGELVETGAGAAVMGNPIRCVAWLANKLAEVGEYLEAGEVILAGALHRAVPVSAGDSVVAEFDRLGCVRASFA